MRRILFLDLDGTVRYNPNPDETFINTPDDVAVYPEAATRIARAIREGWRICFVTNQGGIAAGYMTRSTFFKTVARTNALLSEHAKLDVSQHAELFFCPHQTDAGCFCRKPRPGMIAQALLYGSKYEHPTDTRQCLMVGDRREDEACALAAGVPFIWADDWRAGNTVTNEIELTDYGDDE
jgi:D-glycero-D-manno-heptose 1,7-bisphosphate phosphatase